MVLNKYKAEYKHALSLMRERNELHRQKHNINPVKLDKPIQHGYVRSLELRDDVKYRKDAGKIAEVVKLLGQHKVYHPTTDFLIKTRKSVTEKHAGLKTLIDPRFKFYYTEEKRQADIDTIKSLEKYLRYHPSFYVCSCSEHTQRLVYSNNPAKDFRPHYSFAFPWMLQEVTKQHFLTHYTPVDSYIESRMAEIDKEMYDNNYYKLLDHRRVYDKLSNEDYTQYKYGKDRTVIYHALEELNEV